MLRIAEESAGCAMMTCHHCTGITLNLLDKLLGRPTLENLAGKVVPALHARGATQIEVRLDRAEIATTYRGESMQIYLGNLFDDYRRSPRSKRQGVIDRFIDGMLQAETAIPARYADARSRLMPVVRSTADLGIADLSLSKMRKADASLSVATTARRPLVGDLVIALVCDLPTSMAYVLDEQLAKWDVSFEQALDDALDNLRGLPEHGGWKQLAPGLWSGEWGDSYESSRLLLPDLIHRVGVSQPVVFAPFRNALLLASAADQAAIAAMARSAELGLQQNSRWLSFRPLRLEDRDWVPYTPPEPVAETLRVLQLRNTSGSYASQKQLLDALHDDAGIDVFVATYQLMQRGNEPPSSYSVWGDGVDTLLPVPELIAFAYKEGDATRHVLVAWAHAEPIVRDLLEVTEHQPTLLRVRGFPDAATLGRLSAVAIPLKAG
jgi:hypothetical protein